MSLAQVAAGLGLLALLGVVVWVISEAIDATRRRGGW
jgi:hypothetical protein